ncbi:MAG TPA: STAS domain-containing protein [Parafilimonas sp.]|nr:STAS domain-containing protein [Parafilimonas sp.]
MNFKIDTREKFTIITPVLDSFSDNLTADLSSIAHSYLEKKINVVLNLKNVLSINEQAIQQIAAFQQQFYEENLSFVLCELQPAVEALVEQLELDDVMNITPSETEAWDIVQMEEIERELLDDEENSGEREH